MILNATEALLPDGWARDVRIRVEAGRIVEVRTGAAPDGGLGEQGERGHGGAAHSVNLVLPAPVNLHSHTFQRAMAGLTEARGPDPTDSFWTWRRLMYRFLDALQPDQIEAIAALAFMEMLEAGFGAVAEFHYLHHAVGGVPYDAPAELAGRIAAAAERAGMGLTLLPVLYQRGGCDGRALAGGQQRFGTDPAQFARLVEGAEAAIATAPDAKLGVAPHSLRAVDRDGLAAAQVLAGDGPLHMHIAEQVAEIEEVRSHLGARPVEWLLENAPVGPRWALIHCTHMSGAETERLAATGAVAGLCPITEGSLGDGIFDGVAWQAAGGRMGFGTDSNVDISMWGELRSLEYSQRLRDRTRAALATPERSTGRVLFDAACAGGAQAAGRDSGAIAPGMWADLLGLEVRPETLGGPNPLSNPETLRAAGDTRLDAAIFGGHGGTAIRDVWSGGRHVVSGGRHVARDAIVARYRIAMATLGDAL